MIHAAIALGTCVVFGLLGMLGLPCWFCLFPAVWYMGREFSQAEYRYIEEYCGRKRANMPWYAPFTSKAWTTKAVLDWLLPWVICAVACGVMYWVYR